jgi:hypothetical protein
MKLKQPTPEQIRKRRLEAGLTRREAAELVHAIDAAGAGSYRTWQNYELEPASPEHRPIPLDRWELFLLKTEERIRQRAGKV